MNKKAPRLGDRAEKKAIEQRGLTRATENRQWRDAVDSKGRSVEIKSAMRTRSNGREGRFRIFKVPHEKLQRDDGFYLFAPYRQRGTGVQILDTKMVRARAVRVDSWTRAGHETTDRGDQKRIPISEVFNR